MICSCIVEEIEESELMRFFTCVYICDLFVLKFTYHLIDSIFDAYAIYASPVGFYCIKLKTIK